MQLLNRNLTNGGFCLTNRDSKAERWREAKARCRLSDEALRMAKELSITHKYLQNNAGHMP